MSTYFKNLTVELHILYVLNTCQILCQSNLKAQICAKIQELV